MNLKIHKYKSLLLFSISIVLSFNTYAQAPESMNYQAVIRDGSGELVSSQQVGLRIKILQGSATGSSVYEETYSPTTNAYGLVNLQLGTGTVQSGTFSSIDWGNGPYFVETAADVSGGTSYVMLSTTQFMSVPYALYAKNAGLDSAAVQAMIDAAGFSSGGDYVPFYQAHEISGTNIDNFNFGELVFDITNRALKILEIGSGGTNFDFFTAYPDACNDGYSTEYRARYFISFQVLDTLVINTVWGAKVITSSNCSSTNSQYSGGIIDLYVNQDTTVVMDNSNKLGSKIDNNSILLPGNLYTFSVSSGATNTGPNFSNISHANRSFYTVNSVYFSNVKYGKLSVTNQNNLESFNNSPIDNTTRFPYFSSGYFFRFSEPQKTWLTIGP